MVESVMMVFGELPNMSSMAKSIGLLPVFCPSKVKRLLAVTSPTWYIGERSLSAIRCKVSISFWPITKPILSCDSLPMISLADRVGSPTGNLSKSISPPVSSTNSDRQFKWPPAPWSCMETIGFSSLSTKPRMALAARFCISGLERCMALSSIPEPKAPVSAEETAAPPIPIR